MQLCLLNLEGLMFVEIRIQYSWTKNIIFSWLIFLYQVFIAPKPLWEKRFLGKSSFSDPLFVFKFQKQ